MMRRMPWRCGVKDLDLQGTENIIVCVGQGGRRGGHGAAYADMLAVR